MSLFQIIAVLVTLAALFSYLNYRYIGLPSTVGLMVMALSLSFVLEGMGALGFGMEERAAHFLARIDFNQTVLHGMLGFLLFAGALHVNFEELAQQRWAVILLATLGVVLSTLIIGVLLWLALGWLSMPLPFIYCLIFGALISPTDPIAVLAILKGLDTPKGLEMKIAGEALFNDGVGVVLFLVLVGIATGNGHITAADIGWLFVKEWLGGVVFGLISGAMACWLLTRVDDYQVEVLITLALVMGGYALAEAWHLSAPLAIVVAGLLIGNHGRHFAMSAQTRRHLATFWELIDEIFNAVLFVLIGLEVLVLIYTWDYLLASLVAIPIVLLARFVSVGVPVGLLRSVQVFAPNTVKILTWGGLRGGVSVALALTLPAGPERSVILPVTYAVVAFSIIAQGLTIKRLLKRD
ncbi:MAG: sodium:proton antiporter [Pseudomonadota bacterium]